MTKTDTVRARERAYRLLGSLYLRGLRPDVYEIVRALPGLGEAVPETYDEAEAAAVHHQLFGFNVFPYSSLFLDGHGRLGGGVTERVRYLYRRGGYQPDAASEGADHVGHELHFLAFLSGAEADALEDDEPAHAERVRLVARQFLDSHLLWWLPPLMRAVEREEVPLYEAVARLTMEVVVAHRRALGRHVDRDQSTTALCDPPAVLEDDDTGLKEIAGYLTTPAWSGLYLSRDDVGRLGRSEQLPRGFGNRALMLTNLFFAAARYDQIRPLLRRLRERTERERAYYQRLRDDDVPGLNAVADAWLVRLAMTDRLLERLLGSAKGEVRSSKGGSV